MKVASLIVVAAVAAGCTNTNSGAGSGAASQATGSPSSSTSSSTAVASPVPSLDLSAVKVPTACTGSNGQPMSKAQAATCWAAMWQGLQYQDLPTLMSAHSDLATVRRAAQIELNGDMIVVKTLRTAPWPASVASQCRLLADDQAQSVPPLQSLAHASTQQEAERAYARYLDVSGTSMQVSEATNEIVARLGITP